jgi:hypothetical protein
MPTPNAAFKKLRVLYLALEFPTWKLARSWSYTAQLGLEEGLNHLEVKCQTITTPWFSEAEALCRNQEFDQVWIEIAGHHTLEDSWLAWIKTLAPVRIGLMAESMEYQADEIELYPGLAERKQNVLHRLKYMTHAVACDEKDVEELQQSHGIPAMWWPPTLPKQFIFESFGEVKIPKASFGGALYGNRASWLEKRELAELLIHLQSPPGDEKDIQSFDQIHSLTRLFLRDSMAHDDAVRSAYVQLMKQLRRTSLPQWLLQVYLKELRTIRKNCFRRWLENLRLAAVIVNLPHFVKTYASRVAETMGAFRPVISWEIADRPRNKMLFENGKEILLFSKDEPQQLTDHIQRILKEPGHGQQIAERAHRKTLEFHTTEKRVTQILKWVIDRETPTYY